MSSEIDLLSSRAAQTARDLASAVPVSLRKPSAIRASGVVQGQVNPHCKREVSAPPRSRSRLRDSG
jgi:hypothetical protein